MENTLLITGGCGFIGSNFIQQCLDTLECEIVNLDLLTYAANPDRLSYLKDNPRYHFYRGDIHDGGMVRDILFQHRPRAVINFAAESHVDQSILRPSRFLDTNVSGTFTLLTQAHAFWRSLSNDDKQDFRFVQISTDEVFGALEDAMQAFSETSPYQPSSPYAASKAAADHFVRAWFTTYGFPTIVTHSSNNYGPGQFPEKLIPLMIVHAVQGKPLPLYGDGQHRRDWLFVEDHCQALQMILESGRPGQSYAIGTDSTRTNEEIVHLLCCLLDQVYPGPGHQSYTQQICYVDERLGHDRCYRLNYQKIQRELGWCPRTNFRDGLEMTIQWYLRHLPQILSNRQEAVA